jgi:hypothetical protein
MSEPARRNAAIAVGDALRVFSQTFAEVDLMAYGAATWDWHRNHYDQPRAQELKFKDVFVDGQNFGAIFAREAMLWAGPAGFIRRMRLTLRTMVFVRETVVGGGKISALRPEGDYQVLTIDQHLNKGDAIVATCVTELRLPR